MADATIRRGWNLFRPVGECQSSRADYICHLRMLFAYMRNHRILPRAAAVCGTAKIDGNGGAIS